MNQQIYEKWKQQKSSVPKAPSFADNVMEQIADYEIKKSSPLIDISVLIEKFTALKMAKPALVASGAIIALIRGLIILYTLLMQTACVS